MPIITLVGQDSFTSWPPRLENHFTSELAFRQFLRRLCGSPGIPRRYLVIEFSVKQNPHHRVDRGSFFSCIRWFYILQTVRRQHMLPGVFYYFIAKIEVKCDGFLGITWPMLCLPISTFTRKFSHCSTKTKTKLPLLPVHVSHPLVLLRNVRQLEAPHTDKNGCGHYIWRQFAQSVLILH